MTEAAQLANLQALGVTRRDPAILAEAEPAINSLFATKWTVTTWAEVLGF